jgi:regulatory protein
MGGEPADGKEFSEALARAMNSLARREHSRRELETKLQHKGVRAEVAAAVVERLEQDGLLSDERFAEAWTRSRINKLFGPLKIRAELGHKGVAKPLIEQVLAAYADHWNKAAEAWVARRGQPGMDRKARARVYRSGCNRGFTHEQMMRALAHLDRED